ncbi:MAG: YciI family protein [Devosia sp.]|nr:YciI family protein [Devosia sp.]
MAYFCIHAFDRPGSQELRARLRESHRVRLRKHDHPVAVRIGGPLLDDAGQMTGTMLVIEGETKDQVEAYLAGDPYVLKGLFAAVTVTGFHWGLGQPEAAHG